MRSLIAGKLEDERHLGLARRDRKAESRACREATGLRRAHLPAGDSHRARRRDRRGSHRRPGLPSRTLRCLHWRHQRGDAEGTPARSPSLSAIPSAGNITPRPMPSLPPRRRPPGAPVCSLSSVSARPKAERDAGPGPSHLQDPTRCERAAGRHRCEHRHRLRARMGHRHRQDADIGRDRADARAHPRLPEFRSAHPLWRPRSSRATPARFSRCPRSAARWSAVPV